MADGRGRFEWNQTSAIIAAIYGIMHDPKKGKAPSPQDFNPYSKMDTIPIKQKAPLTVLKDIFCKEKK